MLKGIKDYYGTLELADPKITVRQLNSLLSHTYTAAKHVGILLSQEIILSATGKRQSMEQQRSDGLMYSYRAGWEDIMRATVLFETTAIATARPTWLMKLMLDIRAIHGHLVLLFCCLLGYHVNILSILLFCYPVKTLTLICYSVITECRRVGMIFTASGNNCLRNLAVYFNSAEWNTPHKRQLKRRINQHILLLLITFTLTL
jgi:hypothetical protein